MGSDLDIFIDSLELSLFASVKFFSKVNFSEVVLKVTMASDPNFFPFSCGLISSIDLDSVSPVYLCRMSMRVLI